MAEAMTIPVTKNNQIEKVAETLFPIGPGKAENPHNKTESVVNVL